MRNTVIIGVTSVILVLSLVLGSLAGVHRVTYAEPSPEVTWDEPTRTGLIKGQVSEIREVDGKWVADVTVQNTMAFWLECRHSLAGGTLIEVGSLAEDAQQVIFADRNLRLIAPGGEITYTVEFEKSQDAFVVTVSQGMDSLAIQVLETIFLFVPLMNPENLVRILQYAYEEAREIAQLVDSGNYVRAAWELYWFLKKLPHEWYIEALGYKETLKQLAFLTLEELKSIWDGLFHIGHQIVWAIQTEGMGKNPTIRFEASGIRPPPEIVTLNIEAVGGGTTSPIPGSHTFDKGQEVELTAYSDEGWQFGGWGGDVSGKSRFTTITLDSHASVTAFFVEELPAAALGERAALLAQQVVGAPYLLGGKGYNWNPEGGWDWPDGRFVDAYEIREGYYYYTPDGVAWGAGIDRSGLVYWVFNKAAMATRYVEQSNAVFYERADAQWTDTERLIHLAIPADSAADEVKELLLPGDLLYLDTVKDGSADHVIIYIGNGSVVHAEGGESSQFAEEALHEVLSRYGDYLLGYGRVKAANHPPVLSVDGIVGQPHEMEPDLEYSVSARYYDPNGRDDLRFYFLILTHPSTPLILAWNEDIGIYIAEQFQDYIDVSEVTRVPIVDKYEGYELNWTFTLSNTWPDAWNAIDFGLYAVDENDLGSQLVLDDTKASFTPDVVMPGIGQAIEAGVAWLVDQQNADGSWGASHPVAETGLAVVVLGEHAVAPEYGYGLASPLDQDYPYREHVQRGLNYLFTNAHIVDISVQPAGNPDTNNNGIGLHFGGIRHRIYTTSIAMMGIAGSRAPERVVDVPESPVHGWTYYDVLQDAVDYLAFGQADPDTGTSRGGWGYNECDSGTWLEEWDRSDQSGAGWAAFGLGFAGSELYGFECTIPDFVGIEMNVWMEYIQNNIAGDPRHGGAGYTDPGGWVNTLKTGHLLYMMEFVGDTAETQRVQDAVAYLVRHWYADNTDPGWRGWPGEAAGYQAMFNVMKGLEVLGIDEINGVDWHTDFGEVLVDQQLADGSWPGSIWDWTYERILSSTWALLTLQEATPPPPPVDVVEGTVTDGTLDAKAKTDTEVSVSGTAKIRVVRYAKDPYDPAPPTGFSALGKWVDVYVPDTTDATEIVIRLYYTAAELAAAGVVEGSLRLYWWDRDEGEWVECSDSGVQIGATNHYRGYIWAKIRADTVPNLEQLTGTPFGGYGTTDRPLPPVGGTAYPINRLTILAPWILLATIMAGACMLVLRRRRAQI